MLYQVNKAQAVGIAIIFQVFLKLCTMKMLNLMQTRWVTPAHAVRVGDDNGVWLLYL